ncbi:MAG: DUF4340 domain-containing protein [Verrucomicrobiae bacterium]|nr:DUF4340 domain-containing protein [Verrucomicrobiae bacterium]
MNRKQLLLIVLAGVVLGGIGLYLNSKKAASFERTDKLATEKLLGDFPVNDIVHITLRQHDGEVNLVKGETWTVKERGDYPANTGSIIEFARKLWDLRPAQSQKIGESQLGRMELLPPDKGGTNSATLVELKDKDGKLIRSVLLGKKSMRSGGGDPMGGGGWPNGRWLYLPDKPGTAYLVSETFTEIEPKADRWLAKDFFKVEKIRSVAVNFPEAANSWKLTRETEGGEWKLADAAEEEKLDAGKTSSFSYALSSPGFVDVLLEATPEQTGLDKPTVITLETFEDFTYTVKVGAKTNDNYVLTVTATAALPKERPPGAEEQPEDKERLDKEFKDRRQKLEEKLAQEKKLAKWTYLVSSWTVDSLLKERAQLLPEKKEESSPTTPSVDEAP